MNIDQNELDELLADDTLDKKELKKIKNLLPSEVYQGRCSSCRSLAVRIFAPRKGLDTVEKKEGLKGVMKACNAMKKNQRVLIDTPSFNLILTKGHAEADGFNLTTRRSGGDCHMSVMLTDTPREFMWHFISRLQGIKTACIMNGIRYSEVKDWFDSLDDTKALQIMPSIVNFEKVEDKDNDLRGGPWYILWLDTELIHGGAPRISSKVLNGDLSWDNCVDPIIEKQLELNFFEYSVNSDAIGDAFPDATMRQLSPLYNGSSIYHMVVEPAGRPGELWPMSTTTPKEVQRAHKLCTHLIHTMPERFWLIETSRLNFGGINLKDPRIIKVTA